MKRFQARQRFQCLVDAAQVPEADGPSENEIAVFGTGGQKRVCFAKRARMLVLPLQAVKPGNLLIQRSLGCGTPVHLGPEHEFGRRPCAGPLTIGQPR